MWGDAGTATLETGEGFLEVQLMQPQRARGRRLGNFLGHGMNTRGAQINWSGELRNLEIIAEIGIIVLLYS
jgi:hypothetical protein